VRQVVATDAQAPPWPPDEPIYEPLHHAATIGESTALSGWNISV
jgi:hypothetical protein